MSKIKVQKDVLMETAQNMNDKMNELGSSFNEMAQGLVNIPDHSVISGVNSKANELAVSMQNLINDYNIFGRNIYNYVFSLIQIDDENVYEAPAQNLSAPNTSVSPVVTLNNSTPNYTTPEVIPETSRWSTSDNGYRPNENPTYGNSSYTYTTGPMGTTVLNPVFPSSGLTNIDYDVPTGGNYNYDGIERYVDKNKQKGIPITLPAGLGSVHTYMGWQCITAKGSHQYKLREAAGMKFDNEGFAKIGDRYVVATTTTFGNVGDFIDVYQEDGTVIKCVIGDIKSQSDAGCTKWGHNNGQCVVEFVVDRSKWYSPMHVNPGTSSCHPEWNMNITKVVNNGNFFDLIKHDNDIPKAYQLDVNSDVVTDDGPKVVNLSNVEVTDDNDISNLILPNNAKVEEKTNNMDEPIQEDDLIHLILGSESNNDTANV